MFEWDESKNAATLRERGFDFAFASKIFNGPTLEREDVRVEYGERRTRAIGMIGDRALFVVYAGRGEVRRIVSARDASRKERHAYRAIYR